MNVEDVMTADVAAVEPATPLREVARIMAERGISGLPVVDGGAVVGVVSEADILAKERGLELRHRGLVARLFSPSDEEETAKLEATTAGESMTSPAITVGPRAPVAKVAELMTRLGVNRLPVVSDGRLVGVVTRADLIRAFTQSDEEIVREIREDVLLRTLWQSPESVEVAVSDGAVTLAGRVESKSNAELLTAFVERVPGVVSVDSKLTWPDDAGA